MLWAITIFEAEPDSSSSLSFLFEFSPKLDLQKKLSSGSRRGCNVALQYVRRRLARRSVVEANRSLRSDEWCTCPATSCRELDRRFSYQYSRCGSSSASPGGLWAPHFRHCRNSDYHSLHCFSYVISSCKSKVFLKNAIFCCLVTLEKTEKYQPHWNHPWSMLFIERFSFDKSNSWTPRTVQGKHPQWWQTRSLRKLLSGLMRLKSFLAFDLSSWSYILLDVEEGAEFI
jgi:hypothetical protein